MCFLLIGEFKNKGSFHIKKNMKPIVTTSSAYSALSSSWFVVKVHIRGPRCHDVMLGGFTSTNTKM
jgi:hypothetical protein